jgi:hypothetical protein
MSADKEREAEDVETRTIPRTVLWYEIAAFGLLIALSWANELLGIPARLFGGPHHPNLREAGLETMVILLVAVPIVLRTRRIVARLFYLEGFLRVCAWCPKVQHEGHWVPIAEFFEKRFDARTSHGMCPDCFGAQSQASGVA